MRSVIVNRGKLCFAIGFPKDAFFNLRELRQTRIKNSWQFVFESILDLLYQSNVQSIPELSVECVSKPCMSAFKLLFMKSDD